MISSYHPNSTYNYTANIIKNSNRSDNFILMTCKQNKNINWFLNLINNLSSIECKFLLNYILSNNLLNILNNICEFHSRMEIDHLDNYLLSHTNSDLKDSNSPCIQSKLMY